MSATTAADTALPDRAAAAPAAALGDSLQRLMLQAAADAADDQAALRAVAQVLALALRPLGVWHRRRDGQHGWSQPLALLSHRSADPPPQDLMDEVCGRAAASGAVARCGRPQNLDCDLLAVPVIRRGQVAEVLLAAVPSNQHDPARSAAQLQLAAVVLTLRALHQSAAESRSLAELQRTSLDTIQVLTTAVDLQHAGTLLANHLAAVVPCRAVAVADCNGRVESRLLAVSGIANVDRHGELARGFQAVLDEALAAGGPIVYSSDPDDPSTAGAAARNLCGSWDAQALLAAPLCDEQGRAIGAWVVVGPRELPSQAESLESLGKLAQPILARLARQQKTRGWPSRLARWGAWLKSRPGLAAVLAGVLLAMACPWPYHIRCGATLEPVVRRFVVAPYEGILEKQLVERGDLVRQGQPLARMDGRELRMRLSALRADLRSEEKNRDAARAQGDVAEAQIAALQVERLRQELQLAEHRWGNLEIRSPLDGIVVAGDLEQAEGAPLKQGQSLYEVSPLDEMVVEVLVPEEEVRHVERGTAARVWLDAFPNQPWSGSVRRLHPRAELRDSQNVFVAEVRLDNSRQLLRPGMNGRARLRGPVRPLAWNLFHRAWEQLLAACGW